MTFRLLMTKKDPRRTDFVLVGEDNAPGRPAPTPVYTTNTIYHARPRTGSRATTTITRLDPSNDRFQVGVIEWPVHNQDNVDIVVGTRVVQMAKSGIYTSPERFTAADGYTYEWQIRDARPQLVPLGRRHNPASSAYVATFVQSHSGLFFQRKYTSSLFIPPEGAPILDDIVVTFVYFECKWRDKEGEKARSTMYSLV